MNKIIKIICYSALFVAGSCAKRGAKENIPPLEVEYSVASSEDVAKKIAISSQIESLYDVIIQPRVDGYLVEISYEDGMPIKRGQQLFLIDPSQLNTTLLASQAELESARAQEVLAHNNYQRAIPLASINAISQSDLDQYRATHSAAIAAVKSAEQSLKNAELNVGYTTITAPIDGVIASTAAHEGDYVGPAAEVNSLTTISYIDTITVEIPIPTNIYLESRGNADNTFDNSTLLSNIELTLANGEPYGIMGTYDYTLKDTPTYSSTVVVVAKFPNPEGRLKGGMFARINADIGEAQPCVVVPQRAVSQTQGINSLWVIKPDSTVEYRAVKLGSTTPQGGWIIDSGVEAGERVLLTGQLKVHNGAKVKPTTKR